MSARPFERKNADRRACRLRDLEAYREGKRRRKALTRNGAFGKRKPEVFNLCVVGTTGAPRGGGAQEAQ